MTCKITKDENGAVTMIVCGWRLALIVPVVTDDDYLSWVREQVRQNQLDALRREIEERNAVHPSK